MATPTMAVTATQKPPTPPNSAKTMQEKLPEVMPMTIHSHPIGHYPTIVSAFLFLCILSGDHARLGGILIRMYGVRMCSCHSLSITFWSKPYLLTQGIPNAENLSLRKVADSRRVVAPQRRSAANIFSRSSSQMYNKHGSSP